MCLSMLVVSRADSQHKYIRGLVMGRLRHMLGPKAVEGQGAARQKQRWKVCISNLWSQFVSQPIFAGTMSGNDLCNDDGLQREDTVNAINGHEGMMVGNEWE